jgi:alpha-glucuronidase
MMTRLSRLRAASLSALLLLTGAGRPAAPPVEDGYDLWLRYRRVDNAARRAEIARHAVQLVVPGTSPTLDAVRREYTLALPALLGRAVPVSASVTRDGAILAGTPATSLQVAALGLRAALDSAGDEGFVIRTMRVNGRRTTVVAARRDVGVLTGTFRLLRAMQSNEVLDGMNVVDAPKVRLRLLDHWDNLDRTVERGYAGQSLWNWQALPASRPPRYRDYARANASLGINGTVLTNVNANATVLTAPYIAKVAALANEFRPYGIRVYLTARFSAPMEIGKLPTADPLDPAVRRWWQQKCDEIYASIPDFGGFVVKANSEGQPGPQDYQRTHADGANMLADAVAKHGGVVMWRAFVYSSTVPVDRIKQAYDEFKPLDGSFKENVLVQVKNGPLDFQPREPFHPLFGAMPRTPLMMEFQVTKEYLGQDSHLVYLGPLFEEVLRADTYVSGAGSTVARVVDGSLHGYARTGMAGVANIGDDRNWTGSHFNQANWYAYGRLAWDPTLTAQAIADEWIRQTFSNDSAVVATVRHLMLMSREAVVNYMTPLGLVHIMAVGHHYGPGPWVNSGRQDWTSVYYHRADSIGLGFDRTVSGSNAVEQYAAPVRDRFANRATVPDSLLLFFHHVRWTDTLRSGRTLWTELVHRYDAGVDSVSAMRRAWQSLDGHIDAQRFADTRDLLAVQESEARWWRDAAIQYFQTFSRLPLPAGARAPAHPLEFYRALRCPAVLTKPRCPAVAIDGGRD